MGLVKWIHMEIEPLRKSVFPRITLTRAGAAWRAEASASSSMAVERAQIAAASLNTGRDMPITMPPTAMSIAPFQLA